MKKILITGMSGLIGKLLRTRLEGRYELTALNRGPVEGVRCIQADLADPEAIRPAFAGQDCVVHLAAQVSVPGTLEEMMGANIVGVYNVFQAAREAGVKRVVFASSGAAIAGWERESPYAEIAAGTATEPLAPNQLIHPAGELRPRDLYGATKAWGEALGRQLADSSEVSVICVRIGRVTASGQVEAPRERAVFLTHNDCAGVLEAAIAAPAGVKFAIVFGVSNNRMGYRDLEPTRALLGWTPEDSADDLPLIRQP